MISERADKLERWSQLFAILSGKILDVLEKNICDLIMKMAAIKHTAAVVRTHGIIWFSNDTENTGKSLHALKKIT